MSSKTCKILILVHLILCIVLTPYASAITFKEYYQGLPDFEKLRPFSEENALLQKELRKAIDKIPTSEQKCPKESQDTIPTGTIKVCRFSDHAALSSIVSKMAPILKRDNFTFWISPAGKERDLIVGYTVYDSAYDDPYFSRFGCLNGPRADTGYTMPVISWRVTCMQ